MKGKKRFPAAYCAALSAAVLLSGCAALLERDYTAVSPHTSQYLEEGSAETLRAEDYHSLVNDLLTLVSRGAENGVVRMYGYGEQAAAVADMDRACREVTMEDPLGAWAVDYITYDCTEGHNCYEITVALTYLHTFEQQQSMVSATTAGALSDLLSTALQSAEPDASPLTVRIGYMDQTAEQIHGALAPIMTATGIADDQWSVTYYPDQGVTGDSRIVEISWQLPQTENAIAATPNS